MIISYIRHVFSGLWSIICITSSLLFMVIFFSRKLPLWMARNIWAPGILFCYGAKVEKSGLENIDKNKPYIYIANHESFLDIAVLFRSIPVNLYFIGKEELKKMPFIGWYMAAVGMIFIDRSDRRKSLLSLKKAAGIIEGGKNVIMFPEGTRSKDGKIGDFKKGTFVLSSMTNVDLMPVRLEGSGKVWDGSNQKITPGVVKFIVGKSIDTSELDGKNMSEFIENVRKTVIEL